jgi:hypothetical protein
MDFENNNSEEITIYNPNIWIIITSFIFNVLCLITIIVLSIIISRKCT